MEYPCGKFDDCSFDRFGSIVRTDRQTQTRTLVGVSNYKVLSTVRRAAHQTETKFRDDDELHSIKRVKFLFYDNTGKVTVIHPMLCRLFCYCG